MGSGWQACQEFPFLLLHLLFMFCKGRIGVGNFTPVGLDPAGHRVFGERVRLFGSLHDVAKGTVIGAIGSKDENGLAIADVLHCLDDVVPSFVIVQYLLSTWLFARS